MTSLTIDKLQVIEVKTDSKYFIMARVLDGYVADAETRADVITEIKDAFRALGCPRVNVAVVIMQGLEIVQVEELPR